MIDLTQYAKTNKQITERVCQDTQLGIYIHKSTKQLFFVKRVEISDYSFSEKERYQQIQKEIFLLTKLSQHPYFITYHGAYINKYTTKTGYEIIEFLLFMELAEKSLHKELMDRIRAKGGFAEGYPEGEIWKFLSQICSNLSHMQKLDVSHRDIKP